MLPSDSSGEDKSDVKTVATATIPVTMNTSDSGKYPDFVSGFGSLVLVSGLSVRNLSFTLAVYLFV